MNSTLDHLLAGIVPFIVFGVPAFCGFMAQRRGQSLPFWGFTAFGFVVVALIISACTWSLWGFAIVPIVPLATLLMPKRDGAPDSVFAPVRNGEPDTIEEPETISTEKWWM